MLSSRRGGREHLLAPLPEGRRARGLRRTPDAVVQALVLESVGTCLAVLKGRRERRVRDFLGFAAQTLTGPPVPLAAVR